MLDAHIAAEEWTLSEELLGRVLAPYRLECRYLKSVTLRNEGGLLSARGQFSIPECFYIADTGHFNAVEFNLCYNQLAYALFAGTIARGLFVPARGFGIDRYFQQQLPDMVIAKLSSKFLRPLQPRKFSGMVAVRDTSIKNGTLFVATECSFADERGSGAEGKVLLACVTAHDWRQSQ